MFYGYCFPEPNGWHTPKVKLAIPELCFRYCMLHSKLFREIMITDENDFCVMRTLDNVLLIPYPNEFVTFSLDDLLPNGYPKIIRRSSHPTFLSLQ